MAMAKGTNKNALGKGKRREVDSIRTKAYITKIKQLLQSQPRNLALFTLGINSNLRSIDLVSLEVSDIEDGILRLTERKTKKRRKIKLAPEVQSVLNAYLQGRKEGPLFLSKRGVALRSFTVSALVKYWCKQAGISGHFASHTLRKTFGYHKAAHFPMVYLTHAFNHASEAMTRQYLDLDDQFQKIYTEHVL